MSDVVAPVALKIDERAADMVTKAVAAIVLEDPFYGYLLLRQEIVQNPKIQTASTNGLRIQYSPKFVRQLSLSQLKGLLKHEIMHIAHMHHLRRDKREGKKWNMACDHAINNILIEAGVSLPPNGLADPQYKDMSAEHVYNLLPPGSGKGPDGEDENIFDPPWNWGGVEDAPGSEDESKREELEQDVKQDVLQAANAAKIMGKMPAGLERLIEQVRESRLPWRRILARFFRSTAKDDYNWMRPNRRFLAHDIYLPGPWSEALGPLVIGIDTSGSMGTAELEAGFGVINGILKQTKPQSIHVIYCDAAVGNVQVFRPADYPISLNKFKPTGGGGTDFRPVFDYVDEKKLKPCAVLYFTDLCGSFPDKAPKYPTIWLGTTNGKAPWGKTLEIK